MYKVLGFEPVDYVSKKGNRVKGHKLYLSYEGEKIHGVGVRDVYLSSNVDYIPCLNDEINIYYNQFNQVSLVTIGG